MKTNTDVSKALASKLSPVALAAVAAHGSLQYDRPVSGRPTLLVAAFCLALSARVGLTAEDRATWLRTNVLPLRTVNAADPDLSDLRPLGPAFDDIEMVLLGEATRGDGTTFEAKARMVRFLHEEKGFDLLAFECGLFDCHRAWQAIRGGRDANRKLIKVFCSFRFRK